MRKLWLALWRLVVTQRQIFQLYKFPLLLFSHTEEVYFTATPERGTALSTCSCSRFTDAT